MITLLMVLFIVLSIILAIFVLIQQGKGDMGLGSLSSSSQTLFGGSGGQEFFERITWALGAVFMLGSLGLAILKSHQVQSSRISGPNPAVMTQQKAPAQSNTTSPEAEKTEQNKPAA